MNFAFPHSVEGCARTQKGHEGSCRNAAFSKHTFRMLSILPPSSLFLKRFSNKNGFAGHLCRPGRYQQCCLYYPCGHVHSGLLQRVGMPKDPYLFNQRLWSERSEIMSWLVAADTLVSSASPLSPSLLVFLIQVVRC